MKEIVITNPNGITLPTKKSLVDDDIKIKIDKSLVGIDGVSVERGLYGAKDLFINGNELPSDTTGLMIDSYAGNINIYNSTEKNDEKINLQLSGYIDVSLNDSHPENIITSENLTPENIKKDVNILGTIGTYEGGSSGKTLKTVLDATKNAKYLFHSYQGDNISDLISYNDTEKVTFFNNMFQGCGTKTFPLINTSAGKDFSFKYQGCYNAMIIPSLNTKNATTLNNTFNGCSCVYKLEITYFNFSVTNCSANMCFSCSRLEAFIIREFGANYVLDSNAFKNCYWLTGTTNNSYNPTGAQGYIYVPRAMIETLQSATNWSALQFRALEDYTKDGTTTGEFDDAKAGLV